MGRLDGPLVDSVKSTLTKALDTWPDPGDRVSGLIDSIFRRHVCRHCQTGAQRNLLGEQSQRVSIRTGLSKTFGERNKIDRAVEFS
jgi:hypothetical protein